MKYLDEILCTRDDFFLKRRHLLYVIFLIVPLAACSASVKFSSSQTDSTIQAVSYEIYQDSTVLEEVEGIASYYGKKFHSKKTSSGEIYDMQALSASHKSYPFGTIVRVTNLFNGLKAIVKINDRLPKKSKRTIDLSVKAAELLDFIKRGITKVKLEVLKWGTSESK